MVDRIAAALDAPIISFGPTGPTHLRVRGGAKLTGAIEVRSSKNAGVALLCATLLNRGRTTHPRDRPDRGGQPHPRGADEHRRPSVVVARRQRPRADPARRARPRRDGRGRRPPHPQRDHVPRTAAALLPTSFRLPYAGGCDLGTRTIEPHLPGAAPLRARRHGDRRLLPRYGRRVGRADPADHRSPSAATPSPRTPCWPPPSHPGTDGDPQRQPQLHGPGPLLLPRPPRRGDRRASGTTTLKVTGVEQIDIDVEFAPSEDPIEAMSLLAAAIVTAVASSRSSGRRSSSSRSSSRSSRRWASTTTVSEEYVAANGHTRLVDLTMRPSTLRSPIDKIHPMPFPGLNIDNLPFFAVIAADRRRARRSSTTGSTRTARST